jgi:predicted ribosome quality control (RQC) complex YloA/Tae2 family protein
LKQEESRPQSSEAMDDVKQTLEVEPEEDVLTQEYVDQQIQQIDQKVECTEQRIAEIEAEKEAHERQVQLLREEMHIANRVTEIKAEIAEDETEEEMTPVEEEPKKERPIIRKRTRSELDDDQENIRVRIWRMRRTTGKIYDNDDINRTNENH